MRQIPEQPSCIEIKQWPLTHRHTHKHRYRDSALDKNAREEFEGRAQELRDSEDDMAQKQ